MGMRLEGTRLQRPVVQYMSTYFIPPIKGEILILYIILERVAGLLRRVALQQLIDHGIVLRFATTVLIPP